VAVDLILGELGSNTPPAGDAVHLVLGDLEGAPGVLTDATLAVVLRLRVALQAAVAKPAAGTRAGAAWDRAAAAPSGRTALRWGDFGGGALPSPCRLPWGAFAGPRYGRAAALPWGVAAARARAAQLPWGPAALRCRSWALPWGRAADRQRAARLVWQAAAPRGVARLVPWGVGLLLPGVNRPLPAGPGAFGFVLGDPAPVHLHFCVYATSALDLVFGAEDCVTQPRIPDGTLIAPRSTYMHTHSLQAFRLPDLTPVPVTAFDLAADADAFGWTLTAQGPEALLTLLAPTGSEPAQLRVQLDGMTWEFVVEGLRRTRHFGRTSATITGRSASALLGDPYSPGQAWLNAVPITAQQAIDEALQYTGVTLDWQCTDWLLPAGAWSHYGTPLGVVRRVADSIGAVVQSPRTGDVISVRPRYPVLPWLWGAALPDVTIALDAVTSEGFERADRPAYEGVYVSGQAQGVLALVKRTGTAPDLLLPLVTDALTTHLDAARQRGEALLGAAGAQAQMTVTLPVLTGPGEPGVIDVGKLVALDGWRGLVRSVRVSASQVVVRQTLTVERHL